MANTWIIVSGEYPPQPGGVSDYTRQVTLALAAAGERVFVFAPTCEASDKDDAGIEVFRLSRGFGLRGLYEMKRAIKALPESAQILVQYVPRAWGWKGMNVAFCLWLFGNRRRRPWVMFHEVSHPFQSGQPMSHRLLALVNRAMASIVGRSAERIFVSIPAWKLALCRLGVPAELVEWLPVPSCIATEADASCVAEVRRRYLPNGQGNLVGHFGTYAPVVTPLLEQIVPPLLEQSRCSVLLLGRNAGQFADHVRRLWPAVGNRVMTAEDLSGDEVATHLSACDCLVQPYPDGVSGRRTSLMAGLALGLPIVTTSGFLTEPEIWEESKAVELVSPSMPSAAVETIQSLLEDPQRRMQLGKRAKQFYAEQFSIEHTLAALLAAPRTGTGRSRFDRQHQSPLPVEVSS